MFSEGQILDWFVQIVPFLPYVGACYSLSALSKNFASRFEVPELVLEGRGEGERRERSGWKRGDKVRES
jgi:hypothetical protein